MMICSIWYNNDMVWMRNHDPWLDLMWFYDDLANSWMIWNDIDWWYDWYGVIYTVYTWAPCSDYCVLSRYRIIIYMIYMTIKSYHLGLSSIILSFYNSIIYLIDPSIYPSIHLSIYPSMHLSIYPSIYLFI